MGSLAVVLGLGLIAAAPAAHAGGDKAGAERAYTDGQAKYRAGDYAGAATRFTAAFDLDGDPVYLYNAAQAFRLAGACADAADYYKRFLDAVPADAPNREKAMRQRDDMVACAQSQKPTDPPPPPPRPAPAPTAIAPVPPPPAVEPERPSHTLAWVSGGIGVAGLALGGYFTHRVMSISDDRDRTCNPTCDGKVARDFDDRGYQSEYAEIASYAVGAAGIAGCIYLLLRARGHDEVAITPTRGGAMLSLTW